MPPTTSDPAGGPRPASRSPGTWLILAAVLVVAAAASGCLGDDGVDPQAASEAGEVDRTLPRDLPMGEFVEVERSPETAVYRWTADAPVVAGGESAGGGSARLETTLTVPGDRFLALNLTTTVHGDADTAAWTTTLLDGDGTVRCSAEAGYAADPDPVVGNHRTHVADCRLDVVQPLDDRETWTVRVDLHRNAASDARMEAFLTLEAIRPAVLHEVDEVRAFQAEADDGTTLRGHVYVPDGSGPHPTILQYSPYFNSAGSALGGGTGDRAVEEGNRTTLPFWMGRFVDRGYAVALVNVRGTGISDGCNAWLHPEVDGADAATVIRTLANRSWSDGSVGMVGGSWHGYTQYAAQLEEPAPLKAVAPVSSVLESWTLWTRRGPTITSQFGPMATTYATFQALTGTGPLDEPRHVRCPSYADHVQAFNELTATGDKTPYFQERDLHGILAESDVPMLVSNGLQKLGEGHILQFQGLWPVMNDDSRLLVGQWPHAYPQATPGEAEYWELVRRWMDHHLEDQGPAPEAGVVDYQAQDGSWHRADAWPPPHDPVRLHLSDGAVVEDPSQVAASTQAFQAGDHDPRPTACQATKALYVSPPLAEPAFLAGSLEINVTLSSTAPNSNVGVYVWSVDAVDPCTDPGDHTRVAAYPAEVTRALSDLRHRGHLEEGEPFPVGEQGVMSMTSHPFAKRVEAGERLVVAVTGGSGELSPKDPDPVLQVHTGSAVEGWLDVPVVDGTLAFEDEAAGTGGG